jgi:hypothetical protein
MGGMKDLWAARQQQHYPTTPGWKDPGISRENAERIERTGSLSRNMDDLKALFASGFVGTADEAAERMGKSPFAIRPACTHLRKLNLIERTPERRTGAGGGTAAVLKLKDTL